MLLNRGFLLSAVLSIMLAPYCISREAPQCSVSYMYSISMSESGGADISLQVRLLNRGREEVSEFTFLSAYDIEDVVVQDSEGPLEYAVPEEGEVIIKLRRPLKLGETYTLRIEYSLSGLIEKKGEYHVFSMTLLCAALTEDIRVSLALPESFRLPFPLSLKGGFTPNTSFVSPPPSRVTADGVRMTVEWAISSPGEKVDLVLACRKIGAQRWSWAMAVVFFAAGAASSAIAFRLLGLAGGASRELEEPFSLSSAEARVIKVLAEAGGELTQKEICRRTGYSKSRVSTLISKLAEKGVVRKEPMGKTNRIILMKPLDEMEAEA